MKIKISQTLETQRLPAEMKDKLDSVLQSLTRSSACIVNVQDLGVFMLDPTAGPANLILMRQRIDAARQELCRADEALEDWDSILKDFGDILSEKDKEKE